MFFVCGVCGVVLCCACGVSGRSCSWCCVFVGVHGIVCVCFLVLVFTGFSMAHPSYHQKMTLRFPKATVEPLPAAEKPRTFFFFFFARPRVIGGLGLSSTRETGWFGTCTFAGERGPLVPCPGLITCGPEIRKKMLEAAQRQEKQVGYRKTKA